MTDVFVGYARADRERVDVIVRHLRAEGWTVWYDDELEIGEAFRTTIRHQISAAKVAIVVWSKSSTESDWVIDEAVLAKSLAKLVPLRIDNAPLPFGFGGVHTHSLADWDATASAASFQTLLRVIRKRLDDIVEPKAEPVRTDQIPVPTEPAPSHSMQYVLAVDLGTTYTAAALRTSSSGSAEILGLGNRTAQIPSVLYRQTDGSFLVGEPAERRGLADPVHVVREFKRRIGDTVPILVAGAPYSPQQLTSVLLRWVVNDTADRMGRPPEHVVLTHPANWTSFKTDLLSEAAALAGLPGVTMCTEPAAAACQYAQQRPTTIGDRICVFDLGGGTFDAAVLERTATGFNLLGTPGGIEQLGGIDFDEAIFRRVLADARIALDDIDPGYSTADRALTRLRRDCIDAKEALSTETDTVITAHRAGKAVEVRLTRSEFEDLIRPAVRSCIDATDRVLRAAHTTPDQLNAFVLVGGSSRIPLITETLITTYHRTVARTTHPKHDVALGAAATPPTTVVPATRLQPLPDPPEWPLRTGDDAHPRFPGLPAEFDTNSAARKPGRAQQSAPPALAIKTTEPNRTPDPARRIIPPSERNAPDLIEALARDPETSPVDTMSRESGEDPPSLPLIGSSGSPSYRRPLLVAAVVLSVLLLGGVTAFILTRSAPADLTSPADSSDAAGSVTTNPLSTTTAELLTSASVVPTTSTTPLEDQRLRLIWETDRGGTERSIWSATVGGDLRQPTDDLASALVASPGPPQMDAHPAFSKSGKIAYLHRPELDNAAMQLMVADANGSGSRVLLDGVHLSNRPRWTPDESAIVLPLIRTPGGTEDLWLVDVSTHQTRQLTDTPERELDPGVSPDGTKVVFRRDMPTSGDLVGQLWDAYGTDPEIFVLDLGSGSESRLTNRPGYDSDPQFSPDGNQIVFTRDFEPDNLDIATMPSTLGDAGQVTRLTTALGLDLDPSYTQDGRNIVFGSERNTHGDSEIYVMRSDGSTQTRMTNSSGFDGVADVAAI